MQKINFNNAIPQEFYWFNEPLQYHFEKGLIVQTQPNTDFWQRTHYGFRNDNGHCLLTKLKEDFSLTAHFEFQPKALYDQCGMMIRLDEENWIKASVEYENERISRLGSVVTNLGYSDWATTDISSEIKSMWYRVSKRKNDFLIENSTDGLTWAQMRIAHLHKEFTELSAGVYACSPLDSSFHCKIDSMVLSENHWNLQE
ncbi:MAG: DUF1349 domain-containing protein [Clostridia bacterium]|nr:DUF1349 domain-containing protein [Clostridia bacterium]